VIKEKAITRGLPCCLEPGGIVSLHIAANDSGLAKLSDSPSDAERGFQSKGRTKFSTSQRPTVGDNLVLARSSKALAALRAAEVKQTT
jgi:hypothetical protein